jgi:hypothetical protein
MDKKMMICPNSKECSPEKRKTCGSRHCEIHENGGACPYEDRIVGCPACIPYVEPSPHLMGKERAEFIAHLRAMAENK